MQNDRKIAALERIADALESGKTTTIPPDVSSGGYLWSANMFEAVSLADTIPLDNLIGIDQQKHALLRNLKAFADGKVANNALLWGAKGCGKSSLVASVVVHLQGSAPRKDLAIIDVDRDSLLALPLLLRGLAKLKRRFVLFLDDLSYDEGEVSYKSLKHALEGSVSASPGNVIVVATSNRRHLFERSSLENEKLDALHPREVIDEKVSLSDRFGLWIGFHNIDQDTYLEIVEMYLGFFKIAVPDNWRQQALEWSITRGARSGRVAQQFAKTLLA